MSFKIIAENEKEKSLADFITEWYGEFVKSDIKIISDFSKMNDEYDFKAEMQDGTLVLDCPLYSFAKSAIRDYLLRGDYGREEKYLSERIFYSDFGAVGDGICDDFEALRRAHEFSNEHRRFTVCSDTDSSYYIKKTGGQSIVIKTDTNWSDSEFIIDDSYIGDTPEEKIERHAWIFSVRCDYSVTYTAKNDELGILERINTGGGIKTDSKQIPLNLGYDALIMPIDIDKRVYRRGGERGNTDNGFTQREIMVVHADNTVDDETPPLFDYDKVDEIKIVRIDSEPINIWGGLFTNIASRCDTNAYYNRGIAVSRANVRISGLVHRIKNQPLGETRPDRPASMGGGPNYNGFLFAANCHNLFVEHCKFSGHVHYSQGSYDLGGSSSNKLVFKNCTQFNMFRLANQMYPEAQAYWGIMGTSFCKNIEYYDCELSRLDAHAGVYNLKVIGCTIGIINAVGGGVAVIENSTIYNPRVIGLRSDYGSTWRGDIVIKNCHLISPFDRASAVNGIIHNADYGYNTVMPNLYIENLTHNLGENHPDFTVFGVIKCPNTFTEERGIINDYQPSQKIVIKQPKGYKFSKIQRDTTPNFKLYTTVIEE